MKNLTRRNFLGTAAVGAAGFRFARSGASADKLAALGGSPVRSSPFPSWPVVGAGGESTWMDVLRSHRWSRGNGNRAKQFEQVWAKTLGARHCLAVANGTSALYLSLKALGIGPGDEVIVPPYTFIATVNAVLATYALPVFVDTDPETFQIDARRIEAAVTERTRCLLPVHLGGSAANLDTILEVARKRRLTVIEDACQAHLGEWGGAKVGTLGDTGCFSFQASKNLNSGEGGAVVTNRADLYEFCESFHNNGRGFVTSPAAFAYEGTGFNLRITEFQAALLLEQHDRLEAQSRVREENATYLTRMLGEIEGIVPAKMYPKCTRNAYHLYMFRYDRRHFSEVARAQFIDTMKREGIPCSGGYRPLNREPFLETTLGSRAFRTIYGDGVVSEFRRRNECPANDLLCEEAVWLTQTVLLGTRSDMEQIVEAVRRIQAQSAELKRMKS